MRVRADTGEADSSCSPAARRFRRAIDPRRRAEAIEFEVPGLAEKMRADTSRGFPAAYLSRQVVGVRKKTLVVALPARPGALPIAWRRSRPRAHAVALVQGAGPIPTLHAKIAPLWPKSLRESTRCWRARGRGRAPDRSHHQPFRHHLRRRAHVEGAPSGADVRLVPSLRSGARHRGRRRFTWRPSAPPSTLPRVPVVSL